MLSVIIVNYNVKYFLEQCLYSVRKAIAGLDAEIIVVDNNSTDGSVAYLQARFAELVLVANTGNVGYAKANNQGWERARGAQVLFLNPDTLLSEDSLQASLQVLAENANIGAVGIRMIDGTGRFLPESKRGFPGPMASFFKLSGLVRIFPRSRNASHYYMGWLSDCENNEVEVLSGAYMMVKREVLEKTGGFDEAFFMYGEDIDLSYRIRQAGYRNFYLGEKTIVHFKGESTHKDIRYTRLFYDAMQIFVKKHYGKKSSGFNWLMRTAITVREQLSVMGRRKPSSSVLRSKEPCVLVGEPAASTKVADILLHNDRARKIAFLRDLSSVPKSIASAGARQIVFCAGNPSYTRIFSCMESLKADVGYWFSAENSDSIVGSGSKDEKGEAIGRDEIART